MGKINVLDDEFTMESQKPASGKTLYSYATIDANGAVVLNAVCQRANSDRIFTVSRPILHSNFYVDRNHFDVIVADPVLKAHYYLYNVYYIEDGYIYVAGITSRFSFDGERPRFIKDHMSTWLNFDWRYDQQADDFSYNVNRIYSIRFNPNYFTQVRSFENLEKLSSDNGHMRELMELVSPYDRPESFIQRRFFMAGAEAAKNYGTDREAYRIVSDRVNAISRERSPRSVPGCYFSFEQFYLSGMLAGVNFYKMK